jgi:hypothetical protein
MYKLTIEAPTLDEMRQEIQLLNTIHISELEIFMICVRESGYEFAYDMLTINYVGTYDSSEHFAFKWLADNYSERNNFNEIAEVVSYLFEHYSWYELNNGKLAVFELHP